MLKNFDSIEEKRNFYNNIVEIAFSNCKTLEKVYDDLNVEETDRLTLFQIQMIEMKN